MLILVVSVIGALTQLGVLIATNIPGVDKLTDKEKARRFLIAVTIGVIGCGFSISGAYESDLEKRNDRIAAAKQLAISDKRATDAVSRENRLLEGLSVVGNDVAGLGIGLGINQEAAMVRRCPAPLSTLNGHDPGSDVIIYKVLHYEAVDLWFGFPIGRYDHAEVGHQRISTSRAMKLVPCLASVLSIPRRPLPQPPPSVAEQPEEKTSEAKSSDNSGALFGVLVVLGLLYLFFGRKKK